MTQNPDGPRAVAHWKQVDQLRREERRSRVVALTAKGWTSREIAKELQIDKQTVLTDLREMRKMRIEQDEDNIEQVKFLTIQRLDEMLKGLYERAASGDLKAVDRVLKIEEMRAEITGLSAHISKEAGVSAKEGVIPQLYLPENTRDGVPSTLTVIDVTPQSDEPPVVLLQAEDDELVPIEADWP